MIRCDETSDVYELLMPGVRLLNLNRPKKGYAWGCETELAG